MCGLTGFIDYKFSGNREILNKMNSTLKHRGPDSEGYIILNEKECQIGLGHSRLSIIDLSSSGNQPMSDETKNYFIIFNGEIYNYKEIKKDLQNLGVKFFSNSDTEVILKSYLKWGMKAVERFIGMFAFVIYDRIQQRVIFCRDRVGVKPFYYFVSDNIILFGSELKSLMAHPLFEKNINVASVGQFLKHGWIGAPSTIFLSTFKLEPAHYMEINLVNRETAKKCYWDPHNYYNMSQLNLSYEDAKENLHQLLKSAFEYRMVADTEVGVFLSGGFDSSLVTAILQKNRQKKINTFSVGFEQEEFNEAPFAKTVANYLGTNHHEIICTVNDALQLIDTLPDYYDEPFGDSSAIPTMLVSKLASSKVKVALSADGGDELFGGYPRYFYKLKNFHRIKSIPPSLRKLFSIILNPSFFIKRKNPYSEIQLEKLRKTLMFKNNAQLFRYRSEPINFSNRELMTLIKEKSNSQTTFYDNVELMNQLDPAMIMMAIEFKTTLPDDLLVKVDRASMAYSLEVREPFLDHRLLEFSSRLNHNFHYRNGKTKSLLRDICYEYIPSHLMDRPKKGFSIPLNKWMQEDLKSRVYDFSNRDFIKRQNIFNYISIEKMINGYYKGIDEDGERMWFYLMFQLWYSKWNS
jgi:asparagine synthase (glutamine-hydrolysing)